MMESIEIAEGRKKDGKPHYDSSMGIIGWLVVALIVWAAFLLPYVMLS